MGSAEGVRARALVAGDHTLRVLSACPSGYPSSLVTDSAHFADEKTDTDWARPWPVRRHSQDLDLLSLTLSPKPFFSMMRVSGAPGDRVALEGQQCLGRAWGRGRSNLWPGAGGAASATA